MNRYITLNKHSPAPPNSARKRSFYPRFYFPSQLPLNASKLCRRKAIRTSRDDFSKNNCTCVASNHNLYGKKQKICGTAEQGDYNHKKIFTADTPSQKWKSDCSAQSESNMWSNFWQCIDKSERNLRRCLQISNIEMRNYLEMNSYNIFMTFYIIY